MVLVHEKKQYILFAKLIHNNVISGCATKKQEIKKTHDNTFHFEIFQKLSELHWFLQLVSIMIYPYVYVGEPINLGEIFQACFGRS